MVAATLEDYRTKRKEAETSKELEPDDHEEIFTTLRVGLMDQGAIFEGSFLILYAC